MTVHQARRECRRKIISALGQGGFEAFLNARQPALDDRRGAELLKSEPKRLLERLWMLERETVEGIDDD
jgi:hypothetical protein